MLLGDMFRQGVIGKVAVSGAITTRYLPESPKAKNQPVGWFF